MPYAINYSRGQRIKSFTTENTESTEQSEKIEGKKIGR